jgi:virginiamycin A acetyltransferase
MSAHPQKVDPNCLHPIKDHAGTVFLKPLHQMFSGPENVEVGEFSYYSSFVDPLRFFDRNVLYNFGFSGARLKIGRYCALAHGTTFIMPEANHPMAGPSTYPFPALGGIWAKSLSVAELPVPAKGDICVGHDVWFGIDSLVMPGVCIGNGAIIGARAVVTRDVPAYAIVAGNPARILRMRFAPDDIARLQALAWWDWPDDLVSRAVPVLLRGDIADLEALRRER